MTELIIKKGIKRTRVKIYDDIDMPVTRFQLANKYWMLDDQIGSSFQDIEEKHLKKIVFVAKDEKRVVDAVGKLSTAVNLIINETNVEALSFACLIHSIDGVEVTDTSEENLKRILDDLSSKGLTMDLVKKKRSEKTFTGILRSIFQPSLRIHPV